MSEAMDSAVDNGSKSEQLSDGIDLSILTCTSIYEMAPIRKDSLRLKRVGCANWRSFLLRKGAIYTTLAANPVSACMHDSYQCTIHRVSNEKIDSHRFRGHLGV